MNSINPLNSLCNAVDRFPTVEAYNGYRVRNSKIEGVGASNKGINDGVGHDNQRNLQPPKCALVELYERRCARFETRPCPEHVRILEHIPIQFIIQSSECLHVPWDGGALIQHVSILCSEEQLGAFLTTISPPPDSEVILMIDTLDLTGTPVACQHLEEMLDNAGYWGNWWRLRCLILQRCRLDITHLSAICSIERITSLWNLEYLDISWNQDIGWNDVSHSMRTKIDFCSPELLLLFNLWRHCPIKRLQIEYIGLGCDVLSVLLSMLNSYVKPLVRRPECGRYHHNGTIESLEYFSLGPIDSERDQLLRVPALVRELERLVCSAPRISYLQCFGLQDSAHILQVWNEKRNKKGDVNQVQEKNGSIFLGNFEAESFCKIMDHRYGAVEDYSARQDEDQSSEQIDAQSHSDLPDTFGEPTYNEELVHEDLFLKPSKEIDPYEDATSAHERNLKSSWGGKKCIHSNLENITDLLLVSSTRKQERNLKVHLSPIGGLENEGKYPATQGKGIQASPRRAKPAGPRTVPDENCGGDRMFKIPKKMGTNESLMVNLDSSPEPLASEQETYNCDTSNELIDQITLDQAKTLGHHRLADASFKLRDGMLDEDSRLGLKYRALAKRLIKDIPSRHDQKRARNAFRLWDDCAQNPWDRKRWDNPSKTQNDEPHLLSQLSLLYDIFEKYKMCLGFPFPLQHKSSSPRVFFSEKESVAHSTPESKTKSDKTSNLYDRHHSDQINQSRELSLGEPEQMTGKKPRVAMILSSDSSDKSDGDLDDIATISGKLSKGERELRRLAAWAWDSRIEDHPPNHRVYGMIEGKRERKKAKNFTEILEQMDADDDFKKKQRQSRKDPPVEIEWSSDDDSPLFAHHHKTAHIFHDDGKIEPENLKQKSSIVPDSQESW